MIVSAALAKAIGAAGAFIALALAERALPAAQRPSLPGRLQRNLALFGSVLLAGAVVGAPLTLAAAANPLWSRPSVPGDLVLDFLVLDFIAWRMHRAYHEVDALWRLHQPHHLDRFLDASSALRFHGLEVVVSTLARALAIVLLAIPLSHVAIFELALFVAAAFYHSNVRLPPGIERALSAVIVTPSLHWVHHHRKRADTDSNYGAVLSVWDGLFGTRNDAQRRLDMQIGVEGVEEKHALGLLLSPLSGKARE